MAKKVIASNAPVLKCTFLFKNRLKKVTDRKEPAFLITGAQLWLSNRDKIQPIAQKCNVE